MRLAFAGTAPFAAMILERLLASDHDLATVYTQPDRRAGRGRKLSPSPVRRLADARGIDVRTPTKLEPEANAFAAFDAVVVAAYGLLLPDAVLAAPRHGCLNVHASLLPRWRGAAPVERAIMAGDRETGVTIMQVDAGLDTGPVYCRRHLSLDEKSTGAEVTEALAHLGAQALLDTLDRLGIDTPRPQDDAKATYAHKLSADDAVIRWSQDATALDRQVRALSGRMAAYTTAGDGTRIRILATRPAEHDAPGSPGTLVRDEMGWSVACGVGRLVLDTVQLNRGKGTPLAIMSAANGYPRIFFEGARLGALE
ncbi:MAG: methionyl-tRNA formyltransferase [Gammaproteobacteria bacterium]|nr:methionyl-tRNA formyltransferase [Gammaproteobacteria bacterium]